MYTANHICTLVMYTHTRMHESQSTAKNFYISHYKVIPCENEARQSQVPQHRQWTLTPDGVCQFVYVQAYV